MINGVPLFLKVVGSQCACAIRDLVPLISLFYGMFDGNEDNDQEVQMICYEMTLTMIMLIYFVLVVHVFLFFLFCFVLLFSG